MRIGYDVSLLEAATLTGVEKYATHLYRHLWELRGDDHHLLFCRTPPDTLADLPDHVRFVTAPATRLWRTRSLAPAIRREQPNIFLSPLPLLPPRLAIPRLATVYECPWRYATGEPINWRHRLAMWLAAFQAHTIVTISAKSAADIRAELGRFAPPIAIVPPSYDPGVIASGDPISRPDILARLDLPDRPYCLFVSTIRPKKNVDLMVESFHHPDLAGIDLLCVGKIADPSIVQRAHQRGATNVHFLGYQPDDIVSHLYRNAEAFLYVSANEGFGLPILEAYANDCPLIASRGGSIPEVAGDAALYLDTVDADGIRRAVQQLLHTPDLRQRLLNATSQRLRIYSWEQSASHLSDLIDQATT